MARPKAQINFATLADGKNALLISDTPPDNPDVNTLWQDANDPNKVVLQWDGDEWIVWGMAFENIYVENIIINNGRFQEMEGVTIKSSEFISLFDRIDEDADSGETTRKVGTSTLKDGSLTIDSNTYSIDDSNLTRRLNHKVAKNNEQGFIQTRDDFDESGNITRTRSTVYAEFGLIMKDTQYEASGAEVYLEYQDLIVLEPILLSASSGWDRYVSSGDSAPIARRNMRTVTLMGAFKPLSDLTITGTTEEYLMCVLPIGYRPISRVERLNLGAGINSYRLTIYEDGRVTASRNRNSSGWTNLPSGGWHSIGVEFVAADI